MLAYLAQKRALLSFLPMFTDDVAPAVAIVQELEAYFAEVQKLAFEILVRLRKDASVGQARAEAEREASEAHAHELQSLNDELQSQAEELESQQEELEQLTEELRESNARLTEQVESHRAVVNASLDAIITMDAQGRVLD